MKKSALIFTTFLISVFVFTTVKAQILSIGVGGGLTKITSPDIYTKDINQEGLGFSSEYNLGVLAKINLPLIPFTPRGYILYHKLSSNGNKPLTLGKRSAAGDGEQVEYSHSILQIGAGLQWEFVPVPAGVNPYLSLDLTYNSFGNLKPSNDEIKTLPFGNSRIGLAIGAGAEITLLPIINLDITANYGWFNLIGKESGEETISAFTVDAFVMFSFL